MSESAKETTSWYWSQITGRQTARPALGKQRLREIAQLYRRGLLHGQHTIHPSVAGFLAEDE